MQIWTVDGPGRWPQQRTFFPNRVSGLVYAPHGHQVLFGMDEGGNERDQLYLMDDEGLEVRALTADPRVRHTSGVWSPDGTRIAFTATRENPSDFTPYELDVASGEVRKLAPLGGYVLASAWLPDGSGVILTRAHSRLRHELLLVRGGEVMPLTGPDAQYLAVRPLPGEASALVLTDAGRDFTNLARLDFTTRELTFLSDRSWDEEGVHVTTDGTLALLVWNEEGFGRAERLDLASGERREVTGLPRGVLDGPDLGRDGRTFLLTAHGPTEAMNVWGVNADAGEATRWTGATLGTVPQAAIVQPEVVHFRSFDGLRVPALYLRPHGAQGMLPVVVVAHGGPERQSRPTFSPVGQYLVAQGYGVLLPNVRGSTGYGKAYTHLDDVERRMDSVADLRAAWDWLVREGGADERRIALYGGSYGGFMVLSALATYPDLWAAGVDLMGIANFVTFLERTSPYRRAVREAEYGSLERDRAFLHAISPLTQVDRIRAPLMVIHGANDPRVPVSEAEQIVAALRARDVPVEYLRYENEGHGLVRLANRLDAYPRVAAFLARHLGR